MSLHSLPPKWPEGWEDEMISPVTGKEPTQRQMNIAAAVYVGLLLAVAVFVGYMAYTS